MDIKEFLEYIISAEIRIRNKKIEIKQLYDLKSSIVDNMAVQTSGTTDKIGNIVIKIEQEKEKALQMVATYIQERAKRIALIETLKNPLEYDVIHLHYVQDKQLTDIAAEKGYAESYIYEIHGKALKNLTKHIESYI